MKKNYTGLEVEVITIENPVILTESGPCPPKWVANDTIEWHGYTVCAQMINDSNNWTGEYDLIPD